jgi:hypothetical protein
MWHPVPERKDGPMKTGISLLLGLLLAFMLVFAYWLRTPHRLGTQWNKIDRGLEHVDLAGDPVAR